MNGMDEHLFFENTRAFLRDGLDFADGQLEVMFSAELIEVTKAFVRQARAFDRDLSFTDIFQACRNAWIMNGLQLIMGIPIQLTPSIFAYSMLYPYTDNLLDDPGISGSELLTDQETLKICLAKGGASVLADGYLVAGKLTDAQRYFLFGYGAYLQLLDDIQDVEEDYHAGLMTVFSKDAFQFPLDDKLNKTYWFGEHVMRSLDFFDGRHIELFKSLMRKSMDLFITESIAQNTEAYSRNYITEFETYSPFHFTYICKQKEQFTPYNGFLLAAIEELAFSENSRIEKTTAASVD